MIRRTLILTILSLFLSVPALAGGTFFQWTDANGVVGLTDDAERIPPLYRDRAVERRFEDLEDRRTVGVVPAVEYEAALVRALERQRDLIDRTMVNPNRLRDCTDPVTVTRERRDHQERGHRLNSLFFVVRDACGDVISETREQPQVWIGRKR